jgi:hypothetical protein
MQYQAKDSIMIEKIILQDSHEVHSVWIPGRRSMASFAIWKAYGLGSHAQWREGQITLGTAGVQDPPLLPEFPGYMDDEAFPDWVDGELALIDSSLPSTEIILKSLDEDTVAMRLSGPAYRMPDTPSPNDAATCLIASRLLLSVAPRLIPPTDITVDELVNEIGYISRIAAILAGHAGRRLAIATARSEDLCSVIPDLTDDDLILKEEADD